MWILLVNELGGKHHGNFMPHESASDVAFAPFSFESLAAYEKYRENSRSHEGCVAALKYYERTVCFLRYERSFMRPIVADECGNQPQGWNRYLTRPDAFNQTEAHALVGRRLCVHVDEPPCCSASCSGRLMPGSTFILRVLS